MTDIPSMNLAEAGPNDPNMRVETFSKFPAEIIRLILSQISSVLDFYSLVRASYHVYSALRADHHSLLFDLLQRSIHVDVLRHDATMTLTSSRFPLLESPPRPGFPKFDFFHYIENSAKVDYSQRDVSLDSLIRLARLHSGIEYLVKDYCAYLETQWRGILSRRNIMEPG
jgi:hypothetical protein